MTRKNISSKHILCLLLALSLLTTGVSFMIKADIGLIAWDAFYVTIGNILGIKEGDMSIISNIILFIIQLILLGKQFKKSQWLQIPVTLFFGILINFMLYKVLKFELNSYILQVILFVFGITLTSFAVSLLVTLDIVAMPLDALAASIEDISKFKFEPVRLSFDIFAVLSALALSYMFSSKYLVREGTILGMVIFNGAMPIFRRYLKEKLN